MKNRSQKRKPRLRVYKSGAGSLKQGAGSKRQAKSCFLLFIILPLAFCLLILSSCGYHFVGKGGHMPGYVTTISIPFFKNKVLLKPDVETLITTALIDEFVQSKIVKVDNEDSEAVLRGVITDYVRTPISFNKNDVIQEYRLSMKWEIELVRNSDGKVLWKDNNITDYEDFKVNAANIDATKIAELDAIRKMAKDMARLTKERMLEDF